MGLGQRAVENVEVVMSAVPEQAFWSGKRVLLTGHSGFKGAWLAIWLKRLGAIVTGVSLEPGTTPNLFSAAGVSTMLASHFCDIRDANKLAVLVKRARPEVILHLAAQALVRRGYEAPVETFATNVMGTVNLLDALRGLDSTRVAVMITTDKVYSNPERPYPFRENDALGGHDAYSASKAAAELAIASYRSAFLQTQGIAVASARAGNVIGGGDWSPDRLIPDAVRAWDAGATLNVRRPFAVRPWQHVIEPLSGYLVLAQRLWNEPELSGPYNFGPYTHEAATVKQVVGQARGLYGRGEVTWGDGHEGPHEAGLLTLETSMTRAVLRVTPRWDLSKSVQRTMHWYREFSSGADALKLCEQDIAEYEDVH